MESIRVVRSEAKMYKSVEELPEVLEPGKYVVGEVELEVYEPMERSTAEELLELLKERKGHIFT